MSYILHLGHQPADIGVDPARISSVSAAFDSTLDNNAVVSPSGLGYTGRLNWAVSHAATSNLWLGFRYTRLTTSDTIGNTGGGDWLVFRNNSAQVVAKVTLDSINNAGLRLRVEAHGDTQVNSAYHDFGASLTSTWFDIQVECNSSEITIRLHAHGALVLSATAANTAGKAPSTSIQASMQVSHDNAYAGQIAVAHIAVLDGVSTIGRRFVRLRPNAQGHYNQWRGSPVALAGGTVLGAISTRQAGQRESFTCTGPALPPASALAALHVTFRGEGSTALGSVAVFSRIGGTDYDTTPVALPVGSIQFRAVTLPQNPATSAPWETDALPEIGFLSVA